MNLYRRLTAYFSAFFFTACSILNASEKSPSDAMQKIMNQPKYDHVIWRMYVKDIQTGEVLYDLNSNRLLIFSLFLKMSASFPACFTLIKTLLRA